MSEASKDRIYFNQTQVHLIAPGHECPRVNLSAASILSPNDFIIIYLP